MYTIKKSFNFYIISNKKIPIYSMLKHMFKKMHASKRYYLTLTICLNVNARGGSNIPTSFCVVSDSTAELTIVFALDSPV